MKRFVVSLFCIVAMFSVTACGNTKNDAIENEAESIIDSSTKAEDVNSEDISVNELNSSDVVQENNTSEEHVMKLFINDKEIPVKWEENDSVTEIKEDASRGDIIVSMSMYSDNEQVGSLGKKYSSSDNQTTTHNGDIVLYNISNIVVFYGSNSWAYTRLGKMDLSEEEVTELLSNGNVSIRLTSI